MKLVVDKCIRIKLLFEQDCPVSSTWHVTLPSERMTPAMSSTPHTGGNDLPDNLPAPIFDTPQWRETIWNKVTCLSLNNFIVLQRPGFNTSVHGFSVVFISLFIFYFYSFTFFCTIWWLGSSRHSITTYYYTISVHELIMCEGNPILESQILLQRTHWNSP